MIKNSMTPLRLRGDLWALAFYEAAFLDGCLRCACRHDLPGDTLDDVVGFMLKTVGSTYRGANKAVNAAVRALGWKQ